MHVIVPEGTDQGAWVDSKCADSERLRCVESDDQNVTNPSYVISSVRNDAMMLENTHMYKFPRSEFYNSVRFTAGNNLRDNFLGRLRNKCITDKDTGVKLE
jgi:hypothetical protein